MSRVHGRAGEVVRVPARLTGFDRQVKAAETPACRCGGPPRGGPPCFSVTGFFRLREESRREAFSRLGGGEPCRSRWPSRRGRSPLGRVLLPKRRCDQRGLAWRPCNHPTVRRTVEDLRRCTRSYLRPAAG